MFNINAFKRRISISSYKYLICMLFILSGVCISAYIYKTDFAFSQKGSMFLLNSLIKNLLAVFIVKYACKGALKYITAPTLLVYSGIGLGTFLMFVLYSLPLYKFFLTVFPCVVKSFGTICLCMECFDFDKSVINILNIYLGGIICFAGELLLFAMV